MGKNIMVIELDRFGTSTPFIARLQLFVLKLRDIIYSDDTEKYAFDSAYDRFFEPAKRAFISYKKILELHQNYLNDMEAGKIVLLNGNTINVLSSIDSELSLLVNEVLSEAEMAFKGLINEFFPFLRVNYKFMTQKEKVFEKGIKELEENDPLLADYLRTNRAEWSSKLNRIRNEKEHNGWNLPRVQFLKDEKDNVKVVFPTIENVFYLDFIKFILSSMFTCAEELIVYILQKQLNIIYVYEMPDEEKNQQIAFRFNVALSGFQFYREWNLHYEGPDFSLLE